MAQISIPGGSGNTFTLTVTGSSATNLATDFTNAVANPPVITTLSDGGADSTVAGALNLIQSSSTTRYALTTPGQYTYAAVTSPTTITASAGSETVLAGGGVSYIPGDGGNKLTFTDGNNVFYGGDAGGSTISGGAGNDTINTGLGSNTVFSGTGNGIINLGDTVGGDLLSMLAGNTLVNAFGVNDTIYASATGTIFGGTGELTFVAGPSDTALPITVVGGSGSTNMFGATGTDLTFANTVGTAQFIAGAGNETLNAANAGGGISFFGDSNAADAASIHDTVVGGSGYDFFSTGGGKEVFLAGSGDALFHINEEGAGTKIFIYNFGASDSVNFAGLDVAQETSLLQTASSVSDHNLSVTLSDGTKVEFLGITSLTGHLS